MSRIQLFDREAPDLIPPPVGADGKPVKSLAGRSLKGVRALDVDGRPDRERGLNYRASSLLENAVNTALALGRPLLVSGEPGCGKTHLGFAIARKLEIERVHFFTVKSNSEPQSLFYEYDALRRFHAAQVATKSQGDNSAIDPRNFIEYRALGRAILDAHQPDQVKDLVNNTYAFPPSPARSVVVIDEIDKAPRDFPNDLLNEIEQLWFRVPELAGIVASPETPRIELPPDLRPIIVITSNLERQLPDAFLRRCVFHHIEYPGAELEMILLKHLDQFRLSLSDPDVKQAIALVNWAREEQFDKSPGLAELLEFAKAIARRGELASDRDFSTRASESISALAKTSRDIELLQTHLESYDTDRSQS
jgi:MoxR-like ATPase